MQEIAIVAGSSASYANHSETMALKIKPLHVICHLVFWCLKGMVDDSKQYHTLLTSTVSPSIQSRACSMFSA